MDKTVGLKDARVRTAIGAIAGSLSLGILLMSMNLEVLSPLLGLVSIMMLVTAYTGLCPVYSIVGFRTNKQ
jgi:hypothetical protein